MLTINYNKLDELAELAGIFADTDGKYYKKFISCNVFTNEEEEEYLPVSKHIVAEEVRRLLDTNPAALVEIDLTIDEATVLVDRFSAAIEG